MRPWIKRLVVALAALCAAFWTYVPLAALYWQVWIGGPLEQELGFEYGTPYIVVNGSSMIEVLTIESVVPGGVFEKAGFKNGDVVRGLSLDELFKTLHRCRGQTATLHVVNGGNGPPLDQRSDRTMTFAVPKAR